MSFTGYIYCNILLQVSYKRFYIICILLWFVSKTWAQKVPTWIAYYMDSEACDGDVNNPLHILWLSHRIFPVVPPSNMIGRQWAATTSLSLQLLSRGALWQNPHAGWWQHSINTEMTRLKPVDMEPYISSLAQNCVCESSSWVVEMPQVYSVTLTSPTFLQT